MTDCVFCNIIAGTAPADLLYEDEDVIVIRTNRPVAPVHLLVIPRKHISSLNELQPEDSEPSLPPAADCSAHRPPGTGE